MFGEPGPAAQAHNAGAEVLLVINASPYEVNKQSQRERDVVRRRVAETGVPLSRQPDRRLRMSWYSTAIPSSWTQGEVTIPRRPLSKVCMSWISRPAPPVGSSRCGDLTPLQGEEESVYGALVQGTRDYVDKHRFPGVVLGLSGGIDSALTLFIAVDALGADRVHSVAMPSRYTSQMSKDDAALQAAG